MMVNAYTFINAVISVLAVFGCWLILRPQKIENMALHKSIDNNLWHRYKDLKDEVDKLNNHIGMGNPPCLKK